MGPNLEVLARHAPFLRLTGIDMSPVSVTEGQKRFTKLGLGGVTLIEGRADSLTGLASSSADVVFTDAMFLYIGPDTIRPAVREMMRVARLRMVLLEMHQTGSGGGERWTQDGWVRNYDALFRSLPGVASLRLIPLPAGLRRAGRWPLYGMLIEVDVTKTHRQ